MSNSVIQIDDISKRYRLGVIGGRRLVDDVNRAWAKLRGRPDPLSKVGSGENMAAGVPGDELWALRNVSLKIEQGEALGIIGRNGAGKSTLLKILSRITAPTSGEIRLKGRIASLLEVGTGFHPELTGRENVFLNGAILGMTKDEIRKRFDEIVTFSDVERFIDTPVKRYSSGMKVRLAFAVAAHLEAEILIVDEVLAVGDAEFQKKCLGKMGDVTSQGRTVLFVSHNMAAVQALCQTAVFLEGGRLTETGEPSAIVSKYLSSSVTREQFREWEEPEAAPGNDVLRVSRLSVSSEDDPESRLITMRSSVNVETGFWSLSGGRMCHLTFHLLNEQGIIVLTTASTPRKYAPGEYVAKFRIPGGLLNSGVYSLKLLIVENGRPTFTGPGIASFSVVDISPNSNSGLRREPGVIQPELVWEVRQAGDGRTASKRVEAQI